MADTSETTVLIVEDEPAVVDSYEMMLEGAYDVRTAADGEEALETIDGSVDVVLLDRMMPGMSGDEVLEAIRDRGIDCRVVMVTAVDPDFDIIEMGFDDYLQKPPTESQLHETVEELLDRSAYSQRVREYRSLLSKRSVLETEKNQSELEDSDEFADLQERIDELREELDEESERLLDDTEFVGALRDIDGPADEVDR